MCTLGPGGSRDPQLRAVWTWSTWSLGDRTEGVVLNFQSPVSEGETEFLSQLGEHL